MYRVLIFLILSILNYLQLNAQDKIEINADYNKIIISPHIETIFVQGKASGIQIESIKVPKEDLVYEIKGKTWHIYLKHAKTFTKNKKLKYTSTKSKRKGPVYKGTIAKVIVTYNTPVKVFSIRGEEKISFTSPIIQKESKIRIYGASKTTINTIEVAKLKLAIFGDAYINIKNGRVKRQKINTYGQAKVLAVNLNTKETKINAYGDAVVKLNVSEELKVNAFGEAKVLYKGNPDVNKGIIIGKSIIRKIE